MKKYFNFIFDVGANDGSDGLALAYKNKEYFIHAFEANPYLIKKIKSLKKKLETRIGKSINNYKIHNLAVGSKKRIATFNISSNHRVSSLNKLSKNLDKSWPGYKEKIFKVVKKIKVRVITLDDFMKKNKIKIIDYLHVDTQGSDMMVLKGLKSNINSVLEGKVEAATSKKKAAYINNHTIDDVKKFFSKTNIKITSITKIEHISDKRILKNEADIRFKNFKMKKKLFINRNYNNRYYGRVNENRTSFKDDLFDFLLKIKNFF